MCFGREVYWKHWLSERLTFLTIIERRKWSDLKMSLISHDILEQEFTLVYYPDSVSVSLSKKRKVEEGGK